MAATLPGMRPHLLAAAALLAAVTACSSSSDDQGTPACADVWQAGHTLPAGYEGCTLPDGSLQAAVTSDCAAGKLTTYQDAWAYIGGKVHETSELATDAGYKDAFNDC